MNGAIMPARVGAPDTVNNDTLCYYDKLRY